MLCSIWNSDFNDDVSFPFFHPILFLRRVLRRYDETRARSRIQLLLCVKQRLNMHNYDYILYCMYVSMKEYFFLT